MKILHLVGGKEDVGGVLQVLRNLQSVSNPGEFQHEVWVSQGYRERRSPPLAYRYSRSPCEELDSGIRMFWQALRAFGGLRRQIRSGSYDVLHGHSRVALVLGLLIVSRLRRPFVFTNHNYARRKGLYQWAAGRPGMRTVLLTPNMARHYGIDPNRANVEVISACYHDRFLETPLPVRESRQSGTPIRLTGVGNVIGWKNWHLILEALARLPQEERAGFEVHIWGPTPDEPAARRYEQRLKQQAKENQLESNVRFRGQSLNIQECLRDADWFILPSTNEPCSVALMEALASGIPAIVSASGGCVDLVRDRETGLYFKPGDSKDLALRLQDILNGRTTPASPADVRESVRRRCASAVFESYRSLYRKIGAFQDSPSPAR